MAMIDRASPPIYAYRTVDVKEYPNDDRTAEEIIDSINAELAAEEKKKEAEQKKLEE